jgi:hypothetical protein
MSTATVPIRPWLINPALDQCCRLPAATHSDRGWPKYSSSVDLGAIADYLLAQPAIVHAISPKK